MADWYLLKMVKSKNNLGIILVFARLTKNVHKNSMQYVLLFNGGRVGPTCMSAVFHLPFYPIWRQHLVLFTALCAHIFLSLALFF